MRESGEVSPYRDSNSSDLVMPPLQVWRSTVYAVLALKHLERVLLEKKMDARAKAEKVRENWHGMLNSAVADPSRQDFEAMLSEYFEVTRGWLARVVRAPLLSVLQDVSLDIDLGGDGIFDNSKGPLKLLSAIVGRKLPLDESAADADRLLKLKVRVKAIVDLIVRAVYKHEIPVGLLEFWRRLVSDGVYFPASVRCQLP